jgi:quercetin dioxygenase-like cupin family protein
MKYYIKEDDPFIVPTDSLKLIEEHFGNASNKHDICSISRMEVPPRWKEPFQNPEFDEFTIMTKGKLCVEINGEPVEISAGQSILVKRGARVRYSNPHDYPSEYWSVCIPPFSLDTVHREKQ